LDSRGSNQAATGTRPQREKLTTGKFLCKSRDGIFLSKYSNGGFRPNEQQDIVRQQFHVRLHVDDFLIPPLDADHVDAKPLAQG
jgi:hypothetical protein